MTAFEPERDVPLAPLSTLGVGGSAAWFGTARSTADVQRASEWCAMRSVPLFVLGGGSNLVVADDGFAGLALKVAIPGRAFTEVTDDAYEVRAGAGEPWDRLVADAVRRSLGGFECLSGIPGSVGGTPIQNVGAYGQEVADTIVTVEAYDRCAGTLVRLAAADCRFAYRMSRFKRDEPDRWVVCGVTFRLSPGAAPVRYPDLIRYFDERGISTPQSSDIRQAVLTIRARKGMVVDPDDPDSRSVGSFFMNPILTAAQRDEVSRRAGEPAPAYPAGDGVKMPAAWLIERAGFPRGSADGRVGTSGKHPLAIVNRGGASARDVVRFALAIKQRVLDRFGVRLRPEPVFLGFDGDPDVEELRG
jgi:UDP-N-acetylmuramate dehydrogenase